MSAKTILLPLLWLGLLSCSTGAGDGRIWGKLFLPQCSIDSDEFDMKIDFFAASDFNQTLTIRLQRSGKDQTFTDGVLLVLRNVHDIAEALETNDEFISEITLEPTLQEFIDQGPEVGVPRTSRTSPAAVTLYLNDTCPDNTLAFTDGTGTLTLESIYLPDEQKRIKGSFDLTFVDPRYWESSHPGSYGPTAELKGEFDFNYTRGSPAQTFP